MTVDKKSGCWYLARPEIKSAHIKHLTNKERNILNEDHSWVNVLWNHYFSSGSMFVVSRNFPGLWGCYFVGSAIRVILINIKQLTVYRSRSVGVLIHVQWLPTKAMNIGPPQEQWWFHRTFLYYFCIIFLCIIFSIFLKEICFC